MNERTLLHLDLFSGIGGFALAAAWAGFRTVAFCEIDTFCQRVLKKHWPSVPIEADIRNLDGRRYGRVDLLTAGVPCQPASLAGKRRGPSDHRWLWPDAIRVLREAKPLVAVFENPVGILSLGGGLVFEDLLSQMESCGYELAPSLIVPACAAAAGHRRNRVIVVAYSDATGLRRSGRRTQVGDLEASQGDQRRGLLESAGLSLINSNLGGQGLPQLKHKAVSSEGGGQ